MKRWLVDISYEAIEVVAEDADDAEERALERVLLQGEHLAASYNVKPADLWWCNPDYRRAGYIVRAAKCSGM